MEIVADTGNMMVINVSAAENSLLRSPGALKKIEMFDAMMDAAGLEVDIPEETEFVPEKPAKKPKKPRSKKGKRIKINQADIEAIMRSGVISKKEIVERMVAEKGVNAVSMNVWFTQYEKHGWERRGEKGAYTFHIPKKIGVSDKPARTNGYSRVNEDGSHGGADPETFHACKNPSCSLQIKNHLSYCSECSAYLANIGEKEGRVAKLKKMDEWATKRELG